MLCSEVMVAYKWFIANTDCQRTSPSYSTAYWLANSWNDVLLNRSAAQSRINYFGNHHGCRAPVLPVLSGTGWAIISKKTVLPVLPVLSLLSVLPVL